MRSRENVNELNATYFYGQLFIDKQNPSPYNFTEKKEFSSNESYTFFARGGDIR
jgi:hypothetical protein